MPTPVKPIIIGIKNTNLEDGEYVKVTNLTAGGTLREKIKSNEAVLNPSNSNLTWSNGDSLLIESNGRIPFSSTATITKGGARVTSTANTVDAGPTVSL